MGYILATFCADELGRNVDNKLVTLMQILLILTVKTFCSSHGKWK